MKLRFFLTKELMRRLTTAISKIFTFEKKIGGLWVILNLKPPNEYIEYLHCKMNSFEKVFELVLKNYFMASMDLTDTCFAVAIPTLFRKYLRF